MTLQHLRDWVPPSDQGRCFSGLETDILKPLAPQRQEHSGSSSLPLPESFFSLDPGPLCSQTSHGSPLLIQIQMHSIKSLSARLSHCLGPIPSHIEQVTGPVQTLYLPQSAWSPPSAHSVNQDLLSAYHVPGTGLGARSQQQTKQTETTALEDYIQREGDRQIDTYSHGQMIMNDMERSEVRGD